ncbi:unnamed protein product [Ilex paraguariensis]|uniref:F-box domain-containing protein n=1 Tax=Ilex paraguariensis TaxID=185542 RepID=A0ABC8SWL9_9AQUA
MVRMQRNPNPNHYQDQQSETTNGVGLPCDLIIEILSRLPAKFICQLRCISKSWRAILSPFDPVLQTLHRNLSNSTPFLFFFYISYHGICFSSFDTRGQLRNQFTKHISSPVWTWQFCQGLLCFVCSKHIYVCNPSTQELLEVPYSFNLRDIYNFAFGYLPSTNEYKIVHWFSDTDINHIEKIVCQIFTIKEGGPNPHGSWRVVGNSPLFRSVHRFPLCMNGSLYWIVDKNENKGNPMKIHRFDLAREEHEIVLTPKAFLGSCHDTVCLLLIKDSLCLVDFSPWMPTIDIWMMKDQSNQIWVKEYIIDIFGVNRPLLKIEYIPSGDGCDEEILIRPEKEGLLLYNFKTKSIRRVGNLISEYMGIDFDLGRCIRSYLYVDSLYSLGSG